MPTIITGTDGPIYLGYPPPAFGAWNQVIHTGNFIKMGHHAVHFVPSLYGYPPAFPYLGPYVPFRFYR